MCEDTVGDYTAHKITRADLDQSANVLTNLKRTIALVPLSFLDTSNSVITKTFGTGNWTGTYFNAANPTYDLQNVRGRGQSRSHRQQADKQCRVVGREFVQVRVERRCIFEDIPLLYPTKNGASSKTLPFF